MNVENTNINMGNSNDFTNIDTSSSINRGSNTNGQTMGDFFRQINEEKRFQADQNTNTTSSNQVDEIDLSSFTSDTWDDSGMLGAGATLAQTADNLESDTQSFWQKLGKAFGDFTASFLSTGAVVATTVTSGIADLVEGVADGIAWTGGKVTHGASWLLGSIVGIFDEDAGESIKDFGRNFDQDVKEAISVDVVGEINKWFYESTPIGSWINEHSSLKYDSEAAQKIRGITEKAAEVAAAVALTVFTGGAAAPFAVGLLYGMGTAGEKTYQQNGTDTSLLQELGIVGSGALTGLSWMATGKLGAGFLEIGKTAAEVGVKQVLSKISKDILTKDFWMKALKEGLTGANGVGNYAASAMMTGEDLIPYITGEKEFDAEAAAKLGFEFLKNLGLNVAEDALRGYVGGFKATEAIASIKNPLEVSADDLAKKIQIYTRGAKLSATSQEISIDYLLRIASDPDYSSKLLNGDLLDEVDGLSRLELGNAFKDLLEGAAKNQIDLGLDAESIARAQKYADSLSGDPVEIVKKIIDDNFSGYSYHWNADYLNSPEGRKMISYMRDIAQIDGWHNLPNGHTMGEEMFIYEITLYDAIKDGKIVDLTQDMFDDLLSHELTRGIYSKEIGQEVISVINKALKEHNVQIPYGSQKQFELFLKKVDLMGYDEEVYKTLSKFAGAYVPEGKLKSIIGSFKFLSPEEFAAKGETDAMAFNNGKESVMSLDYESLLIKCNCNHESVHQISHAPTVYDELGRAISKAGVKLSVYSDDATGWQSRRKGINECITELFSKLSLGDQYIGPGYCGYDDGVEKLEGFIDSGIISVEDLKKFYFTNDGDGLMSAFTSKLKSLGIKLAETDLEKFFDDAISRDNATRKDGLKHLTKILKEVGKATLLSQ